MTTNKTQSPQSQSSLEKMPNIGRVLAEELAEAGIESPEQLIAIGSNEAFRRIHSLDDTACLSKYYALEGAVQGIRWHDLSQEDKQRISKDFKACKRK